MLCQRDFCFEGINLGWHHDVRQLINPKDHLITISLLGMIPKVDYDKIPINSQENDDHTEPYIPKLLLFYNFGMKLKSSHLILI